MMKNTFHRPYPRNAIPESEAGGMGIRRRTRPQLSARWVVDNDGKLTCRWDLV